MTISAAKRTQECKFINLSIFVQRKHLCKRLTPPAMGTNDGRDIFDEKGGCPISFTDHKKKISLDSIKETNKNVFKKLSCHPSC